MACYHPIEAWDYSAYPLDPLRPRVIKFAPPSDLAERDKMIRQGRQLQLPCRHCVGCRLSKSREWANRVVMEQLYHDESWFLTLTYDDAHLPRAQAKSALGNTIAVHATLVKKDLQDFFKRLRKNTGQKIRYFAAGEYGSQTMRPHYHLLIFGLHLDDLSLISKNFAGTPYFVSDSITKCWPKGIHILGQVTWQSAAYVARYTMKKATHGISASYFVSAGIQPEFQVMSNRPGLAYQYYVDHPDIFEYDYFSVSTPQGGRKVYPPEYFKKLFKSQYPDAALKRSLNLVQEKQVKEHLKLLLTDLDYYDILKVQEEKQLSRLTALIRNTI